MVLSEREIRNFPIATEFLLSSLLSLLLAASALETNIRGTCLHLSIILLENGRILRFLVGMTGSFSDFALWRPKSTLSLRIFYLVELNVLNLSAFLNLPK